MHVQYYNALSMVTKMFFLHAAVVNNGDGLTAKYHTSFTYSLENSK